MEHAPLRPVPSRPAGPIEPGAALREVTAWLPSLAPEAARALALVVLAERPRGEVAETLGVSAAGLGELLAAARKELRRTLAPLGGSGWCERAERLISDRLDGELAEANTRTLDVHLRNCPRCVEHERRLVQATDALIGALSGTPGLGPAATVISRLDATETDATAAAERPDSEPAAGVSRKDSTEEDPAGAPVPPAEASPPPVPDDGAEAPAASPTPLPDAGAEAPPASPAPLPDDGAAVETAPTEEDIAAAVEVLVAARTRRQIASAVAWYSLIALAVLLALATIALTVAGILGAEL
jgi:hypothetical protein